MVPKQTTIMRRVLVGALMLSLVNAFVAGPANADHVSGIEWEWFSGEFAGSAAYMAPVPFSAPSNPTGITEPVVGVMVCGPGDERDPSEGGAPDGAGGACPPVYVQDGDEVFIMVCDGHPDMFDCRDVSFGACVDGDDDGLCRPEHPADSIYFSTCNRGERGIATTHEGPSGPLSLFVMYEPTNAETGDDCTPTYGHYFGAVGHPFVIELHACQDGEDNDGNGLIDWPNDPGCDSPEDDLERFPHCRDGIDNDNDGLIDYPDDPGCSGPDDWSEPNPHVH